MLVSRFSNRVATLALAGAFAALFAACSGGGGGGETAAPKIVVNPAAVSFAQPFVGRTYTQALSIQNTGSAALNVTGITLDQTSTFLSLQHPSLPFVVLAGTPETVTLTLLATSDAPISGTITIASNDPAAPSVTVPVSATSVDNAALKQCVLVGAAIIDGCDHAPGDETIPQANLGTVNQGQSASKVVVLWNDGPGNVPVAVSAIDFDPAQADPSNYSVTLFTKSGPNEVAATLPFYLNPPDGATPRRELYARITYHALAAEGPVSGVSLQVTTTHPAGALSIPIAAQVGGCPVGFADCDGNVGNGCEVDTTSDLANCGGCGQICGNQHANPQCNAGVCNLHCVTDATGTYSNCDGQTPNGCEVNLSNDAAHCGTCANACSTNHATPTCVTGSCGILSCQTGWADCDTNVTSGCETSITTIDRCGSCTNNCPNFNVANAASYVCNSAAGGAGPWACGVGTCTAGHTDMDKAFNNGCECTDEGFADTCDNPANSIDYGIGGPNTISGFITPLADQDYVRVNFVSDALCPDFSPAIAITDPTSSLVFDVLTNGCAGPMTCTTGGASAIRNFSTTYTLCGQGCAANGGQGACNSTYGAAASIGTSYVVRVYSVASTANTCLPYTITVSN